MDSLGAPARCLAEGLAKADLACEFRFIPLPFIPLPLGLWNWLQGYSNPCVQGWGIGASRRSNPS